jgi:hypothetical protein
MDEEFDQVLDYLFAKTKDPISEFLQTLELPFSGSKEVLRERVVTAVRDGVTTQAEIVDLLNRIEGWGNQHVYLYQTSTEQRRPWRTEVRARQRLARIEAADLMNERLPIVLPDEPTLVSVEWSAERVRFVWVEKRAFTKRREDLDHVEGQLDDPAEPGTIIFKAFEGKVQRAVTTFDWNLVNGNAALLIHQLQTGENYVDIRNEYEAAIDDAVGVRGFQRIRISRAIQRLVESEETRNRQVEEATEIGGQARLTSGGRADDITDDPGLVGARNGLGNAVPVMGNFYWLEAEPNLEREVRTKLYASDQRVGIFKQCTETEVRHVLSRIRHFAR